MEINDFTAGPPLFGKGVGEEGATTGVPFGVETVAATDARSHVEASHSDVRIPLTCSVTAHYPAEERADSPSHQHPCVAGDGATFRILNRPPLNEKGDRRTYSDPFPAHHHTQQQQHHQMSNGTSPLLPPLSSASLYSQLQMGRKHHQLPSPQDRARDVLSRRAKANLRYGQQVSLAGAYSRLLGGGGGGGRGSGWTQRLDSGVDAQEALTHEWRCIQQDRALELLAHEEALGRRQQNTLGGGRRSTIAGPVVATTTTAASANRPGLAQHYSSMAFDGLSPVVTQMLGLALHDRDGGGGEEGAQNEGSALHLDTHAYDQLLMIIRQLVLQQEDLAQQLREAKAANAAVSSTLVDPSARAGAQNGIVSSSSVATFHSASYSPSMGAADMSVEPSSMRPPPISIGSNPPVSARDASNPAGSSPLAGEGCGDVGGQAVSASNNSAINSLRDQLLQAQQRETEWRRQVNTLQLMVDDAREEMERSSTEHAEEVSKLQKTIDFLLQDIEMDIGNNNSMSPSNTRGDGSGGAKESSAASPPGNTVLDKDAEDKVKMLRKVRSAIQRGGSVSPLTRSAQALQRHYASVVNNAMKEENEFLATSFTDASQLVAASPEIIGKLHALARKSSMRRAQHQMPMHSTVIATPASGSMNAGEQSLENTVSSAGNLLANLGASPASDGGGGGSSSTMATTPQKDHTGGEEGISSLSVSTTAGQSPATAARGPGSTIPPSPAPPVFHANNPNQIGEIVNPNIYDEQWMFIQSIRAGLQAEVCKNILDHYEESQKPKREGPLKGIVKGLVSTVAAAASTVASTVTEPLPAGTDITREVTEYFCHLAKDAVVTRKTLPTSLPPLKVANTNKQLLQVFHNINATFAPNPAIGNAEGSGQGRLVCRGDQIRLRFFAPKCFAMIREKLGVDPEHLRLSIEQCDWRKAASPGKSEAVMFYFGDYVLKTVKNVEASFLKSTYVPAFTSYAASNPHTLLPQFMTFFSVTWLLKRQTFTFVLMKNVFSTQHYINMIYDLKGSTVGREAAREEDGANGEAKVKRTAFGALLLKDNDLPPQLIYCGPLRRAIMIAQLQADTLFLQSLNIVDYSLMVGVRSRVVSKGGSEEQRAAASADVTGSCLRSSNGGLLSLAIYDEHDMNTVREDTYYIGIIDCLQPYNSSKKLEHFAKGLLMYDRHKISVVPPEEYAERLCKLIDRITV